MCVCVCVRVSPTPVLPIVNSREDPLRVCVGGPLVNKDILQNINTFVGMRVKSRHSPGLLTRLSNCGHIQGSSARQVCGCLYGA